jgi:hypothetical protein
MTATDVNHVLGKLYTAVAHRTRVPARNAATLAYIGQLLLNPVNGVKSEFKFSYSFEQWLKMFGSAKPLSPPPALASLATNGPAEGPDDDPPDPSKRGIRVVIPDNGAIIGAIAEYDAGERHEGSGAGRNWQGAEMGGV